MPNALSPADKRKKGAPIVLGASLTDEAVSEQVGLSAKGSLNLRIDLEVSGVTVGGGITAKLQSRSPGGNFVDLVGANASIAITADGTFSMTQNIEIAADQPNMPLQKMTQVVITTGAGSAITVDRVYYQQEL